MVALTRRSSSAQGDMVEIELGYSFSVFMGENVIFTYCYACVRWKVLVEQPLHRSMGDSPLRQSDT